MTAPAEPPPAPPSACAHDWRHAPAPDAPKRWHCARCGVWGYKRSWSNDPTVYAYICKHRVRIARNRYKHCGAPADSRAGQNARCKAHAAGPTAAGGTGGA